MAVEKTTFGLLENLLADGKVTAIYVSEDGIRYEKEGALHSSTLDFSSDEARLKLIQEIIKAGNGQLSRETPTVDCILSDGTKVQATLQPLSLELHKA
ncbi:MAG: hypothetical protein KC615_16355 [Anaerolineae bacterium]|nr:hypothetical protein [Anaerolineae bacterium]